MKRNISIKLLFALKLVKAENKIITAVYKKIMLKLELQFLKI
jgi:hypothetical protein